VEEVILE